MKKIISILFVTCFVLTITACSNRIGTSAQQDRESEHSQPDAGQQSESERDESALPAETEQEQSSEETVSGGNILVAYFSLAGEQYEVGVIEKGNTEIIAEMIADATGGDTFKIESTKEYPTTYDELLDISRKEEEDPPEIASTVDNMDEYDTVFLGYPIWWYTMAPAVLTYLNSQDWNGKTVVPFMTNAGWPGHVIKDMQRVCKGAKSLCEMQIQFDSSGGDHMETPEGEVRKWIERVKELCE